jgi:hypothetical protein
LILRVAYEDGDGDLGLDPNDSLSRPFHQFDFIFNDSVKVVRYRDVVSRPEFDVFLPELRTAILEPFGTSSDAPPLTITNSNFTLNNTNSWFFGPEGIDSLLVLDNGSSIERERVFGGGFIDIGDVLQDGSGNLLTIVDILTENDTAWIESNENFFNFFVDIYYENAQGQLEELDLEAIIGSDFNGRFPVLVSSGQSTPIIGTITQRIVSAGFINNPFLRNELLVLSVKIQDRRLNRSDSALSNPFRYRDFVNF